MILRVLLKVIIITSLLSAALCSRDPVEEITAGSGRISVVSLSPSISRQIIDLDAEDIISGVTTYHDFMKKKVPVVGSIVNPNLERILEIGPDYVFLSAEDAQVQKADRIIKSGLNVVIFPANRDFRSISVNYLKLASLIGKEQIAMKKIQNYENILWQLTSRDESGAAVALFVSLDPLIPVSGNSYLGDIIRMSGCENIFENLKMPYPVISYEELYRREPEVILVAMDNPDRDFFNKKFSSLACVKEGRVFFPDPEPFVYYTPSDFVRSVDILKSLLGTL